MLFHVCLKSFRLSSGLTFLEFIFSTLWTLLVVSMGYLIQLEVMCHPQEQLSFDNSLQFIVSFNNLYPFFSLKGLFRKHSSSGNIQEYYSKTCLLSYAFLTICMSSFFSYSVYAIKTCFFPKLDISDDSLS